MGKTKRNKELLSLMEDYNLFMSAKKQTQMPVVVREEKPNHKSSLYLEQEMGSDVRFGRAMFDCEIRNKNRQNYSFQISSDKIEQKSLARLDEGNGVHRNNIPHIPLAEQEITTPHFHKYDSDGRFVAYKTNALKEYNKNPLKIEDGFRLFCNEEKISSFDGSPLIIEINENGVLPMDYDSDPLAGVNF